jgi:hypothetical protein
MWRVERNRNRIGAERLATERNTDDILGPWKEAARWTAAVIGQSGPACGVLERPAVRLTVASAPYDE